MHNHWTQTRLVRRAMRSFWNICKKSNVDATRQEWTKLYNDVQDIMMAAKDPLYVLDKLEKYLEEVKFRDDLKRIADWPVNS